MEKEYRIRAVVGGAHYELTHPSAKDEFKTYDEAFEQMLRFKNAFNENALLMTAQIGSTRDVIRTDTIEKMYVVSIERK